MAAPGALQDTRRDPLTWPTPTPPSAWPVGSVFTSVVPTNPATLLGYGTWSAFAAGRVLVGLDALDPDFDTVGKTAGAKTKPISAHTGTAVADHAAHTHGVTSNVTGSTAGVTAGGATAVVSSLVNNTVTSAVASPALTHTVTQPNAHTDLNVVQPYFVVYFWQRTA